LSLFSAAERLSSLDHSAVKLNLKRCLYSRDRFSGCEACFDICPVHAITPGKPPSLDSKKCENCLACLVACSMGAYEADDAVVSLLNAVTHLENSLLELVCVKNPQALLGISDESTGIRIRGCLAGLGSGTYLALAALGLEHIVVRTDACARCEWGTLFKQVEEQVNQAVLLLEAWDKDGILTCVSELNPSCERPLWEAANPPLSRRDMFRMVAQQGKVVLARAIDNGQTSSNSGPGRDRLRLLGAIQHLPAPKMTAAPELDEMNFAVLSVSEVCTACGVCARACPTGALQFNKSEDDSTYTLVFKGRNCISCEICNHVCAPSAITLDPAPTFAQIFSEESITLREGDLMRCSHCGTLTADLPGVSLCPLCEFRKEHPFGSMLPPGLKRNMPPTSEEKPE
jgi:NAD-dependent dihydropyrimidine dehydrogenase PreA subunit